MAGELWGIVLLLILVWVAVEFVLGVAGAVFHLLLAAAAVLLHNLVRAGACRRP